MKEIPEQDEYIPFGEPVHFIQRDILLKLRESSQPIKYSEIKPIDSDGNAFNHHLKALVSKGIVAKTSGSLYELSPKGKLAIDQYSLKDVRIKTRPISGVFVLARSKDELLLVYENKGAPIANHQGLLFGKLRLGQSYESTLARMLSARNLSAQETGVLGQLNIRYLENGELVAQRTGPLLIVQLDKKSGDLDDFGTSTSKVSWVDINHAPTEIKEAVNSQKSPNDSFTDLEIEI